jgi:hypothetical protein
VAQIGDAVTQLEHARGSVAAVAVFKPDRSREVVA